MISSLNATSLHTNLISQDKKPSSALLNLLATCGIEHDNSLASIITATQKEQPEGFIRPKNKERWQIVHYLTDKKNDINFHCNSLGMFHEIQPSRYSYDYIILFGGTIKHTRSRIAFLIQLWQKGVRGKKLIILTGQRILDPAIESEHTMIDSNNGSLPIKTTWQFTTCPTTETDMVRMLFEQALLPEDLINTPIDFIDTPMQQIDGQYVRPNTADTIHYWLRTHPVSGSILAISAQPLVAYQDAVVRRFLPSSFTLETVGPAAEMNLIEPEILIGTVGWWLYNAQFLD